MTTRARHRKPRLSEADFQVQITQLAETLGWVWMHVPRVLTKRRNRDGTERFVNETATKGPGGNGWPDLTLWRDRLITSEVKGGGGVLSDEQIQRREEFRDANHEHYVWWPADWDEVVAVLTRRAV